MLGNLVTQINALQNTDEIGAEHQTAIRLGATAIWSEQVEKQEHFINSGRLITHLQAIRNNKELKESISINMVIVLTMA